MENSLYLPELWINNYLEYLAKYGRKDAAAYFAHTSPRVVNEYREKFKDFEIEEEQALEIFRFSLHKTMVDQAIKGVVTVKQFYKLDASGNMVLYREEKTTSDDPKLALELAKVHDQEYRKDGERKDITIYINAADSVGQSEKVETINIASHDGVEDAEEI